MSLDVQLREEVRDLLALEADLLDRKRWREWLDLYLEDCVYWVPAWIDEETTGTTPNSRSI